MNKLWRDKKGNTILLTILILTSVLLVSLTASTLVTQGINLGSRQSQSAKAYFAAEAGLERILYLLANGDFDETKCDEDECLVDIASLACVPAGHCQDTSGNHFDSAKQDLSNGSFYVIRYASTTKETVFTSSGEYLDTRRKVEAAYPR